MKGHFSVEWLSQSSQAPYNSQAMNRSSSWIPSVLERPSTSGTVPESLPGFYSRRADNTENQQIQSEPAGPTQSFNTIPKHETSMTNAVALQHGKFCLDGFSFTYILKLFLINYTVQIISSGHVGT